MLPLDHDRRAHIFRDRQIRFKRAHRRQLHVERVGESNQVVEASRHRKVVRRRRADNVDVPVLIKGDIIGTVKSIEAAKVRREDQPAAEAPEFGHERRATRGNGSGVERIVLGKITGERPACHGHASEAAVGHAVGDIDVATTDELRQQQALTSWSNRANNPSEPPPS